MEARDPKVWGPPFWKVIDTIADAYPASNPPTDLVNAATMFFTTLKLLLPCEKCRQHYSDFVAISPPPLQSGKKEFIDWISKLKHTMTPQTESTPPKKPIVSIHKRYQHAAQIARSAATFPPPQRPAPLPANRQPVPPRFIRQKPIPPKPVAGGVRAGPNTVSPKAIIVRAKPRGCNCGRK